MPRVSRLFLAAALSTLAALVPVTALAGTLTEFVVATEYAVGSTACGETGSFAGYGSATLGGKANAAFNTTICHTSLKGGTADINRGGSFILAMGSLTLVGQYTGGTVKRVVVTGNYFCKEVFKVTAYLGKAASVPPATSISGGSATGWLTHYGVRTADRGCHAYAATITGWATLLYSTES